MNAKELIERYQAGERDFSGLDFSGIDFDEINPSYDNLTYLSGTNFSNANLSNANLSYANIIKSNLRGTNFHRVHFGRSFIEKCDCTGASFTVIPDFQSSLYYNDFTNADLQNAQIENCHHYWLVRDGKNNSSR